MTSSASVLFVAKLAGRDMCAAPASALETAHIEGRIQHASVPGEIQRK